MSPVLKCILGLFVCFCFLQYVEMARLRRDAPSKEAETSQQISQVLDDVVAKLKASISEENLKKISETINNAISEGSKTLSGVAAKVGEAINNQAPTH